MRRIKTLLVASLFGLSVSAPFSAFGDAPKKPTPPPGKGAPAKPDAKKPPPPKTAPKKVVMVNAEKKKLLAENLAGFKFGMTKDEVLKKLGKELDDRYDAKIKETTDIPTQDRLRADKKKELAEVQKSWIEFNGKKGGWDVSIIEGEFAHNTSEAMLERWENKDGKNQRRFFFFHQGMLWKMAISLDVSILPADKRNFETFAGYMQAKYGNGAVDGGEIAWTSDEFEVRAVDRLKAYTALILAIEDNKVKKGLVALRAEKAEKKPDTSPVIKSVIDTDGKDKPDVKSNNNAVDQVINAHGGGGQKPPKK